MKASQIYIIVSILALLIIGLLMFFIGRRKKINRLTPLASLAFGFVLAGIIFGDARWLGYSLIGTGVVLALIDMVKRLSKSTHDIGN